MKLVTSLAVAALMTASAAFAGEGGTDVNKIRDAQIVLLEKRQAVLDARMTEAMAKSERLGTAKVSEGGYTVDIDKGLHLNGIGEKAAGLGAVMWTAYRLQPQYALAQNMRVPSYVFMGVGTVVFIGGYLLERNGRKSIRVSEGEMKVAVRNLEALDKFIADERAFIMSQATTLGVPVSAKVTNWQGVHLPDNLRQLGGTASNLNINHD